MRLRNNDLHQDRPFRLLPEAGTSSLGTCTLWWAGSIRLPNATPEALTVVATSATTSW